jgi:o-succinylbenzoate---CoA ligase
MAKLYFNNNLIDTEQSDSRLPTDIPASVSQAIAFCREWEDGSEKFTLQTSGSTGTPKQIEVFRSQLEASAQATIDFFSLKEGQTALVCLNTDFVAGKMMLVRAMIAHMKIVLVQPESNPLKNVHEKIDFVAMVPMQLKTILDTGTDNERKSLDTCTNILVGGAALSDDLEKQASSIKAPIYIGFGMTETLSHIALRKINGTNPERYYTKMNPCTLGIDHRGCLTVQGAVTNNEKVITNDLVELIDENQFNWLGRIDNIINSGGVKLFAEVLEKKLAEHLSLHTNFFFYGIPHPLLGQAVALFIEGTGEEALADRISKIISANFSKYEIPKQIIFIPKFKYTATEKIHKPETVKPYLSHFI